MLHAINYRLLALESCSHVTRPLACARCGGLFDNAKRESGPTLMERTVDGKTSHVICCYSCEPYAKRNGWARSKPPLPIQEAQA